MDNLYVLQTPVFQTVKLSWQFSLSIYVHLKDTSKPGAATKWKKTD
jgi:hypothetical protein